MTRPIIAAIGISHRDVELATLWLRWVSFLCEQPGGDMNEHALLIVITKRLKDDPRCENLVRAIYDDGVFRKFKTSWATLEDEIEDSYPKSASHLFLRTLEVAETRFPGHAVLWCEADTVPMKPSWFAEIASEYQTCGKPFLGVTVGTKNKQLSGIAVYPADWRKLAPKLASVLSAPDMPQWGHGKGMPWDVFARDQTVPQMAESRLMTNVWKNRDVRATRLREVPRGTVLFHQDKTGALIREIASAHYPEFMATITTQRRFFFMNGHASRLTAKGLNVRFSYTKFSGGFHRSAVCSDELSDENASALATLVGQLGVREITEEEFLKMTGRTEKSLPAPRIRATHPSAEAPKYSHPHVYVMLGRYGDICNVLPMLKADADAGHRPTLVVSKDFADILDGVSYCDRIVWDGAYDRLEDALRWLRRDKGIASPVVCQYHRNPYDKGRLTDSYQKEVWRLAGKLSEFNSRGPLVFDKMHQAHGASLMTRTSNRPLVLIGLTSISSPLKNADGISGALLKALGDTCCLVEMDTIRANRIYDLIGLFDTAALLISADTAFIHLARASKVTLIALANDGWRGSVTDNAFRTIRYADATPQKVVDAAKLALSLLPKVVTDDAKDTLTTMVWPKPGITPEQLREIGDKMVRRGVTVVKAMIDCAASKEIPRVYHVYDPHGSDARHHVAQSTWAAAYADGMIPVPFRNPKRDAKQAMRDPRALPFLKDVLWNAIPENSTGCGGDIIVWGNSDIGFAPGITQVIRDHVSKHHAATMRRTESNGHGHPGRDLFAFTIDWLLEHFSIIPDYVIGAPFFDLGIVAIVRKFHELPDLTLKNLSEDMVPADIKPGYALHQSHEPEWSVRNMNSVPSVRYNRDLLFEWAKKNCPGMKFSPARNLK